MNARHDATDSRPAPERADRFRPTRCGVINLWDYRDEEFVFADGRMVLRGPNGSGKTKALEVLFPFVLDGRIEPRRLNPFAGEERTMKSNLLYRGQESAYAYVWMEFRRDRPVGDDAGEVVTVGAGLRAQRQNDRVTRWYFVVDGQVGRDFSLLGPDDRPLTKRQLAEQIGAAAVTDRPIEHRTAIDARLFGLGGARFEQLLTLVLTLRRPQLAKNLDPKGLSRALSDGLRPLDDSLIVEAAHSFGDMENVQRTLAGLVQADAAASTFLAGYTTYLRTHARTACDALTLRLTAVEDRRAGLAGALAARQRSATERDAARALHGQARQALHTLTARLDSLKASPAYRDREQLNRLAALTADLGQAADRDRRAVAHATGELERRMTAQRAAQQAHRDAVAMVMRVAGNLTESARDAGIDWARADNADDGQLPERAAARTIAREDDIRAIRSAIAALAEAGRLRDRAQLALDRAQDRLRAAEARLAEAEAASVAARERLLEVIDGWCDTHRAALDGLAGGQPPGPPTERLREALTGAVQTLGSGEGAGLPASFDAVIGDHRQVRRDELARLRDDLGRTVEEIAGWRRDRAAIADERDQAPPPFAARTSAREGLAGAPLWAVVDFSPGLDDAGCAAVEAALEAANLLDAWVPSDATAAAGGVQPGRSDAVLQPLPPALRPSGPSLAAVLRPEHGTGVDVPVVASLLSSIALIGDGADPGAGTPAAAPAIWSSGRFRQGVQLGAHHKDHAEYIGATARARRRAQRLAALDAQIATAEQAADRLRSAIDVVTGLLAAVDGARRSLPSTTAVVDAVRRIDRDAAALRAINGELDNARGDVDQAVAAVGGTERLLIGAGAARSMPISTDAVDRIAAAVGRFTRDANDLGTARRAAAVREEQLAAAVDEVTTAEQHQQAAAEQAETSGTEHLARVEELSTLRAAVGVQVDELERDVQQTAERLRHAEKAEQAAQHAVEAAIDEAGKREGLAEGATAALISAVTEAHHDSRRLAPYARPDIRDVLRLPATIPAWPTATEQWPDPVAMTADRSATLLDDPDVPIHPLPPAVAELHAGILAATAELRPTESSLKSSRTRVSASLAELQDQLSAAGHDYRPEWEADDDVIVVKVADEQGFSSIGVFAGRISAARRDQELLLSESEQRILEDALLGRLAQQIHDRTTDARDLIAAMNREMRSRRMSSGATVGIGWELAESLDPQQRTVSRLLDREAARLSTDDLAQMRAHFATQIKDLRAARPERPYAEILAEALDYRQWRAFVLTLVGPDGKEDRLTTARHSTLSGGEQSVSLHLPLFAAAHVMLSSAAPHCPRLLALDEAFAGIDDAGRSELLGLTAQFDLDLFMTGYDLWATFATVPACAHHDLSHSAVEHTVSALLLVWDGSKILTDAQISGGSGDLASMLGSPGTRRRPDRPVGLETEP